MTKHADALVSTPEAAIAEAQSAHPWLAQILEVDPVTLRVVLVKSAEEHGDANGDARYTLGDLEEALDLALALLTPAQRQLLFARYASTLTMGLDDAAITERLRRRGPADAES